MGNLRNPISYAKSFWDWAFLNKCFTSKIQVSDIDGIVERNGYFLVLETKSPGAPSAKGQRILMENLVKTGYFTVIYIYGFPEKPEDIRVMAPTVWGERSEIKTTESPSSVQHLQEVVSHWYKRANAYPRTFKFDNEILAERIVKEDRQADVATKFDTMRTAFRLAMKKAGVSA